MTFDRYITADTDHRKVRDIHQRHADEPDAIICANNNNILSSEKTGASPSPDPSLRSPTGGSFFVQASYADYTGLPQQTVICRPHRAINRRSPAVAMTGSDAEYAGPSETFSLKQRCGRRILH